MKIDENIKIVFEDNSGKTIKITVTVEQLIEKTLDDFYEMLDNTSPCTSASCNTESQNFCDCGSIYEDFEITGIETT